MTRNALVIAVALLIATAIQAETVSGRITPVNSSRTFGFSPGGAHVELTVMWLKRPVILNLLVECRDEIGSLFFEATSESNGDRIEKFDFGGWDGATCTVTVYDLDGSSRTKYLLNLRYSFDEPLSIAATGRRHSRALLTPVPTASVPGLEARLAEHRVRLERRR